MHAVLLSVLLLFPTYSAASCWSKENILQQTLYSTLSYIDYRQTYYALHKNRVLDPLGQQYIEGNPLFFDKRPSKSKLRNIAALSNVSFASSISLDCSLSDKDKIRNDKWRWFAVGFRLGVVVHNDMVGLKFHVVL